MSQALKLIKKGDRFTPTVYRFGASEHLNIRYQDQYADLTDAKTGACIRIIGWDGLRDMGYSPAKLLNGNESDQSFNATDDTWQTIRSYGNYIAGGLAAALAIALVGVITGCTSFVIDSVEQDVATSTIEPRLAANSVNQEDLDDDIKYLASKQRQDAKHANQFLASVRNGGAL